VAHALIASSFHRIVLGARSTHVLDSGRTTAALRRPYRPRPPPPSGHRGIQPDSRRIIPHPVGDSNIASIRTSGTTDGGTPQAWATRYFVLRPASTERRIDSRRDSHQPTGTGRNCAHTPSLHRSGSTRFESALAGSLADRRHMSALGSPSRPAPAWAQR